MLAPSLNSDREKTIFESRSLGQCRRRKRSRGSAIYKPKFNTFEGTGRELAPQYETRRQNLRQVQRA
jgi:hypothetical protein